MKPTLDDTGDFKHPLYETLLKVPGLSIGLAKVDDLLSWGVTNALWVFPMATSCCGIELMAAAASRVDMDRMGTIVRATPRHADVMVVAGTITTKMAPRVLKLWEQMPQPRYCVAMGSCAISGDFYRNLYSVVPGIDTFMPVDVYIPGCPPSPEALMHGMLRLQDKVNAVRKGKTVDPELNPDLLRITYPSVPRVNDAARTRAHDDAQEAASVNPTDLQMQPPVQFARGAQAAPLADLPADAQALFSALGAEAQKEGPPLIAADRHLEVATKLKGLGYTQYLSVIAAHWTAGLGRKGKDPEEVEHFEVATLLRRPGRGSATVTWSVRLLPGEALTSLSHLFAGADWQEREQYDLLGVGFAGHPDLRRLMMAENYQGHPLRHDFAADAADAPWR